MSPIAQLLPDGKDWFTTKEAAALLGRSQQFVRDCFDNQALLGHTLSSHGLGAPATRRHHQIPRHVLLLYLLETANYRPGDFLARVLDLARTLTPEERERLRVELGGK